MRCSAIVRCYAFCGVLTLLAVPAWTQQPQRKPDRENVRCQGKIKAVGRGILQVEGAAGEQWLVAIEARPDGISFQGVASPGFLRVGMLVEFGAALDKKGEAQGTIAEVNVVSPRVGVEPGVKSEGGLEGKELFANEQSTGKRKGRPLVEKRPYAVVGTIRALKDRKFLVSAGNAAVKGEFASDCTVAIDVADYTFARVGDAIDLAGWHYPGQSGQIHATNLTIVAEQPLLSAEEAKKRRPVARNADKSKLDKTTDGKTADGKTGSDKASSEK